VTPVVSGKPVQLVNVPEDGVPRMGVTSVGDVANTTAPLPVSFVSKVARLAEDGVAKNAEAPEASPLTPVLIGSPVQLVNVPEEGVPRTGVVRVGEVRVLFVRVAVPSIVSKPPVALTLFPRAVATPVPKEVIPVPPLATGRVPVIAEVNEIFVSVLDDPEIVLLVNV
jgi:hypothetical protein